MRQDSYAYGANDVEGRLCPAKAAGADPMGTFAATYDDRARLQAFEVLDVAGTLPEHCAKAAWFQALGIKLRDPYCDLEKANRHVAVAQALGWINLEQAGKLYARLGLVVA